MLKINHQYLVKIKFFKDDYNYKKYKLNDEDIKRFVDFWAKRGIYKIKIERVEDIE